MSDEGIVIGAGRQPGATYAWARAAAIRRANGDPSKLK